MSDQETNVRPSQKMPITFNSSSPVTEARLREVAKRIVEAFDPERIILFGSYASGEPTSDSDVDLLIVMENEEPPARRSARVAHTLLDIPFPIDIIVRTPEELQHRLDIGDYFIQDILDRGRAIYKRKQVSR